VTRFGWWEDIRTTHTDLRAALAAASRRTRDVDEDVGVVPPLSLPRSTVDGGLLMETAAMGVTVGGPYLRSHARGWEIAPGKTLDMRAFLGRRHELADIVAEVMPGVERLMVHVVGPWTFGASVEYHGHPLCFDRPAFRDVALALGEGVREFCDAVGASVVHVHERRFPEVTSTLVGATEFETMSVDREIATNVEGRFIAQVRGSGDREVVLDAGCLYPELTALGAALVVDRLDDDVARLIDGGTPVAWRVGGERTSEELAHTVMRTWRQWTFDAASPEPQIDLVACSGDGAEGVLKPNAAAELARTVRGAAALLHRN
jgi:hypothetical protein